MPVPNKSFAFMAADMKTQTLVLRKIISDYPQCLEVDTATIASRQPLYAIWGHDDPEFGINDVKSNLLT